jgi:hypothetical protein
MHTMLDFDSPVTIALNLAALGFLVGSLLLVLVHERGAGRVIGVGLCLVLGLPVVGVYVPVGAVISTLAIRRRDRSLACGSGAARPVRRQPARS